MIIQKQENVNRLDRGFADRFRQQFYPPVYGSGNEMLISTYKIIEEIRDRGRITAIF